jgi:hypothetical protein
MRYLTLVIGFAILWAATAEATTPTQVLNVNDPTRHPYQVSGLQTSCTTAGDCAFVFPAITTGNTLILHTSCSFSMAIGSGIAVAALSVQAETGSDYLPVFTFSSSDGLTSYGINADTYLFFAKGQQPRIDIVSTTAPVQNLLCTLSGYFGES